MNKRIKKKLLKRNGYLKYSNYRLLFKTPIEFILYEDGKDSKMVTTFAKIIGIKRSKNNRCYPENVIKESLNNFNFDNCKFLGEMKHPI